jgi:hypothetical protein
VGAVVEVPFVVADLVDGVGNDADHVEGVVGDAGGRERFADGVRTRAERAMGSGRAGLIDS